MAINSVIEQEPKKAIEWFQNIEDPEIRRPLSERLLGQLARVDPASALQLASQIPNGDQPTAFYGLIRGWAFEHPQEAGAWVNNLKPGEARDSAVKAYVSVIDGMDAGMATQWAYSIAEPTERMETTYRVFERWLQNDRAAASAWVEQTDLPEGFRPFFDRLINDPKYANRPR